MSKALEWVGVGILGASVIGLGTWGLMTPQEAPEPVVERVVVPGPTETVTETRTVVQPPEDLPQCRHEGGSPDQKPCKWEYSDGSMRINGIH